MTKIYNRRRYQSIRRNLRRNLARAEMTLWSKLRNRRVLGARFLRQFGVDRYVLDFYCPRYNLAIEVDGASHLVGIAPEYDRDRQQYLEALGIKVMRFWNSDVDQNVDEVVHSIERKLVELMKAKMIQSNSACQSPPFN